MAPESMNCMRLGSQPAPSSMAPNFRSGKRSNTPSNTSTGRVCQIDTGMAMKLTEVKFSAPPWKSSTWGPPVLK